jgi:hypothetical protein
MSVAHNRFCAVKYRTGWSMKMIPWYRQVLSLVYGLGVMLIALWALQQGSGPTVVLGVVGMSMLTLMMIFGVEIESVTIGNVGEIQFTDTSEDSGDE